MLTGLDPDGTSFYPQIPLDGVRVELRLTGSIVTLASQVSSHSEGATLSTDASGNVLIFTNSPIQGNLYLWAVGTHLNFSIGSIFCWPFLGETQNSPETAQKEPKTWI